MLTLLNWLTVSVFSSSSLCYIIWDTASSKSLTTTTTTTTTPFFLLLRAASEAYGSSLARGANQSCSCQPTSQQPQIQLLSMTYTTAHGNSRSLTHQVRPGIKPAFSWIRVRFITAEPQWELPSPSLFWLCPWHVQVPGPEIKRELLQWQCQILNPPTTPPPFFFF